MVREVVLFMEMHQPRRLNRLLHYQPPGSLEYMFDDELDRLILTRVAENSYIKVLEILKRAYLDYGFRFTVSFTGILFEQLKYWAPQVLEALIDLIKLGAVEPTAETYYHSLAYLIDEGEFVEQVVMHAELVSRLTGVKPVVAQNTEFMYSDRVGEVLGRLGFKVVLTEGVERVLGYRKPTYVYRGPGGIRLLLRHYRLSDDVGFRFTDRGWDKYPLTADKYVDWLSLADGDVVMIGLDMETFGEHMPPSSGIFEFLTWMFRHAHERGIRFVAATEASEHGWVQPELNVNEMISWADVEKDTSAWVGNEMQWTALNQLMLLYRLVKTLGDEYALRYVRLLMVSDHFYYMSTKHGAAQQVHSYFNPYYSPYRAYTLYQNALSRLYAYLYRVHGVDLIRALREVELPPELKGWVKGDSITRGDCGSVNYTSRLLTINAPMLSCQH